MLNHQPLGAARQASATQIYGSEQVYTSKADVPKRNLRTSAHRRTPYGERTRQRQRSTEFRLLGYQVPNMIGCYRA